MLLFILTLVSDPKAGVKIDVYREKKKIIILVDQVREILAEQITSN